MATVPEDGILEIDGGNMATVEIQTLGNDDGKLLHETGKDEEHMATVETQTLGNDDRKLLHETGKDEENMATVETQTLGSDDGGKLLQETEKDVKKDACDPTNLSTPSTPVFDHRDLAERTIKQGNIFAQNAKNKYGTPKKSGTPKPVSKQSGTIHSIASSVEMVFKNATLSGNSSVIKDEVPSKTAEASSPVLARVGPVSGTSTFIEPTMIVESNIAAGSDDVTEPATITTDTSDQLEKEDREHKPAAMATEVSHQPEEKEEDREHMEYFGSWGPQIQRDTPAAQHRKVNLFGDPEWHTSPKADFIASLVFGGPLEHIQCMVNSAAVTFINAADAQAFYENTANGIVYRADADCVHYAEARMAIDPTPTSSYVQDLVNQGATRSVRAIGVDPVTSLNSIRHLAEGKIRSQGVPSRKLESLEDTMNANGLRVVTFHYCDIRHAIAFKSELVRSWESVNVHFVADPCAEANGPRVKVRPITRAF